ncbi:polyprotein [Gossypium australe]|uniref:Polyprotein n=1 Tax=Gossypium australe TaxID=47621 RepID=A0A5B6VC85_9ROSI|nr:polyprotein [Gossypium australe]
MDFIKRIPKSMKYDYIRVVDDKFTKYAHFVALSHPYTTPEIAKIYLHHIYKLHGHPKFVILDKDKALTNLFSQQLMKNLGTTTLFSTAYYPEIDGQPERLNQCLEQYLRQTFLALQRNLKLVVCYYGPYTIEVKIGSIAYKLELSNSAKIHLIFHISLLKKKVEMDSILT